MSISPYRFLDSGNEQKLELFGDYYLIRPASQAIWKPQSPSDWKHDALFSREKGKEWTYRQSLPQSWVNLLEGFQFKVSLTDFGHVGLFPEHARFWPWMEQILKKCKERPKVLNLFAYSGGATIAAAAAGASVCHVDASKGMVAWASENATLNRLQDAPIRWIVDDVLKFVKKEIRRKNTYDAIILDPPSFGRGSKGEVFKIERDLLPLLNHCSQLLSDKPLFVLLSCHTPGFSPYTLHHLLDSIMQKTEGKIEMGEMLLSPSNEKYYSLPSGVYAKWQSHS
ncbi:MAG: class I SAM-dependent methyltransferase [Chlamydiales bacterium]